MSGEVETRSNQSQIGSSHRSILTALRAAASAEGVDPAISDKILKFSDTDLLRIMFMSFRKSSSGGSRGLRLTALGVTIMLSFWKGVDMKIPPDSPPAPIDLLYLDWASKMPYYIDMKERIVIFESRMGVKLKLADGKLGTLRAIDPQFSVSAG